MPDPIIGYGSVDKPFNEAFGRITEVHWGGKGIQITTADGSFPLAVATCPALLPTRGSWCTWIKGTLTDTFTQADGFFGITTNSGTFSGAVEIGKIGATFDGPPYQTGYGMFPRGIWGTDDGSSFWTIRPDDSIIVTEIIPNDEPIYYRENQSDMDFDKWHFVQMSWNLGAGTKSIAIDDVAKTVVFEPEPFSGSIWLGGLQDDSGAIPSTPAQIAVIVGEGAHYDWWLSTEYIDFSVEANRRRFITSEKKAVGLGADGANGSPTARAPEFFFKPGTDLTGFTANKGTGGTIQWTSAAALGAGFIDPTWSVIAKPGAAGT